MDCSSAVTKPRTSARGKTCGRGTNAQAVSAAAHATAALTAAKARPRNGAACDSRDWKVGRGSTAVAAPARPDRHPVAVRRLSRQVRRSRFADR